MVKVRKTKSRVPIRREKQCNKTRRHNYKRVKRKTHKKYHKKSVKKKRSSTRKKKLSGGDGGIVHQTRRIASVIKNNKECVDRIFSALARLASSKSKVLYAYNRIQYRPPGTYIPSTPEQWKELFNEDHFRKPNTEVLDKYLMDKTDPTGIIYQAEAEAEEIIRYGRQHKEKIGINKNSQEILESVKAILDNNIDKNLFKVNGPEIVPNLDRLAFEPALTLLYSGTDNWERRISEMPPINVIHNFIRDPEFYDEGSTNIEESVPTLLGRLLEKVDNGITESRRTPLRRPVDQMTHLQHSLCGNLDKTIRLLDKTTDFNEKLFVSLIPFLPAELFRDSLRGAPSYQEYPMGDILARDVEESKSPEPAPVRRRLAFHDPEDGTVLEPGSLDDDCGGSWPCMAQRTLVGLDQFPTATSPSFDPSIFFSEIESGTLTIVDQMIAAVESLYNNHIVNEQSMSSHGSEPGPIHTFRIEQGTSRLLPFTPVSDSDVVDYLGDEERLANDWIAYAVDWHYYKLIQDLYKYILIGKWNDEILRIVRDKNEEIWNYLESIGSGLGLRLRNVLTQGVKDIADATPEPISVRLRLGSMLPENPENWCDHARERRILPGSGEQPGSYLDFAADFMAQLRNVYNYLDLNVVADEGVDFVDSMHTPLPRLSWLLWQNLTGSNNDESYKKWLHYCVNIEYYRLLMLIKILWEMALVENTTANEAYEFCESELPDIMGYMPLHANGFIGMNGDEGVFGQLLWDEVIDDEGNTDSED
tara:strand:+ start:9349 stop:11625 length:2277 start_codon:yes stop_codon:yes gene_type:complete